MEYYGIGLGRHAIIFGREETVDFPHFLDTMDSLQDAEEQVELYLKNDAQDDCKYNYAIFHIRTTDSMTEDICQQSSQQIIVYDESEEELYWPIEWFTKNEKGTAKLLRLLQNAKRNNKEWEFCELIKQYRWDE